MNIIAGENIPYLKEAFGSLGNLHILPGRAMTSSDLIDTNILLIRSITTVNQHLLQDSLVEFVGSASAGIDHLDTNYLKSRNIPYVSAAGSNANSVAEYVIAALLHLATRDNFSLAGKTIGIVGVGNIGKLVKQKTQALGMRPVLHDPPLAERGQIDHRSLEETLGCDVVTLHTPLTSKGPYPTYHLLNQKTFEYLKPTAIFINAARGEVVDTQALLSAIQHNRIGSTVLDVWESEPHINWNLFQAVTLGTPHIAGHSLDGKANGTFMIYSALCQHLNREPTWNPSQSLPEPAVPFIQIDNKECSVQEHIQGIVSKIYDIEADHRRMKDLLDVPLEKRPAAFDELRKHYPVRREFPRTHLQFFTEQKDLRQTLEGLGFADFKE